MSLYLMLESYCSTCDISQIKYEGSVTYNLSSMWRAIHPGDDVLIKIDGMTGRDALPKIQHAIEQMVSERDCMLELQPINGWGSYDGFLGLLRNLRAACEDNLECVWRADR